MHSYAAPLIPVRALDARAIGREAEPPNEAFIEVSNVVRGVAWAVSIEGATALFFYAVWHLWHVWR
jgi:hypothetical protein